MNKILAVTLAVSAVLLVGCSQDQKTPPQKVSGQEVQSQYLDSLRKSTTTFKDDKTDIIAVSIAKGGCDALRAGKTKAEAVKSLTEGVSEEEAKDRATAVDKGIEFYCPEFG